MTRTFRAAVLAAAALACACGKPAAKSATAGTDSAAPAATTPPNATPVEEPSAPAGIAGAPGVARAGVDSANAAAARRDADVGQLTQQAAGTNP